MNGNYQTKQNAGESLLRNKAILTFYIAQKIFPYIKMENSKTLLRLENKLVFLSNFMTLEAIQIFSFSTRNQNAMTRGKIIWY